MLHVQRWYHYCCFKVCHSGGKGDLLLLLTLLWMQLKGQKATSPCSKTRSFEKVAECAAALRSTSSSAGDSWWQEEQPPGSRWAGQWGGHPRLSAHSLGMQSSPVWAAKCTKQQKGFVSLFSTSHLSHLLGFVNVSFLRCFEGMACSPSSLVCGIKLTKHNPNTAHSSSVFLEIQILS